MAASVRLIVSPSLALLTGHAGSAQSSWPPRPVPAPFGPTELNLKRPARLDVSWSLHEAKGDNSLLTSDADMLDPAQSNRSYTGAAISPAHVRRTSEVF